MGQNESTLNPGASRPSQIVTEPGLEPKKQLPNQGNYYSLNNRVENTTTNPNYIMKSSSKTPSHQARIFNNENKPLNERQSHFGELNNVTNTTDRSRVSYSSRPGQNQVKRRNSEDFDMDLMEENTNIINQNADPRENSEGAISSMNSKPDLILNTEMEPKNYSRNSGFYTNKSTVNSQGVPFSQKNPIFQGRPGHKEILTVKQENIQEPEEPIVFDGNIDMRKQQTFGKENPIANEYLLRPTAALMENRTFHNDEVRIMETGFSSSRKMDSEYEQSPAMSARLQDELPKNIMEQINYIAPSKSKATSVSSTQSLPQHSNFKKQNRHENKDLASVVEEVTKPYKQAQEDEKKSIYSLLIEESHNNSPVKGQAKKSVQYQQDSKGFPDAEFSFKPNLMSRDRPRYSVENNSIQANSSRNKMLNSKSEKVLRKSRSQVSKKGLPTIQILESESCSSSYADGPVSTGSASSLSSVPHPYVPQNLKKRNQSASNIKSSRRQSRALEQSGNQGAYGYVNNNYPQGQHSFHGSSFHSMPQGPILTAIPSMPGPVHVMPVMQAVDPYSYVVNQPAYYGNPGIPQVGTPMRNNYNNYPIYYQNLQTPQVGAMPQPGIFTSPQFYNPIQPVQQNYPGFTSPSHYMNVPPMTDYSRMMGRMTPYREPVYMQNKGSDSAREYYQGENNLSMNYAPRPLDKSQENAGYKGLRTSKSLSTLKMGRQTPTNELKMGVSRLEGISYQNQSYTNMRSVSQTESMSRDPQGGRATPSGLNNEDNSQVIKNANDISAISRIGDVSRAKKHVYPEESEAAQELNTTEYSLVQKLEGNGRETSNKTLSIISSPGRKGKENRENKGRKNWQILNRIGGSKVNEKDEDAVLGENPSHMNENNIKAGKKNKMEILLGSNNTPMAWEIKDFTSNKTPDLPRPKSQSSQVLVFDAPKCRTTQSNAKSRQLPPQARYSNNKKEESQKGIKLCFDLTEDFDDGVGKKSADEISQTGEKSLADYFKQRKSSLASKLDEEKNRRFSTLSNNQTKEIDKEELIQKRRDMRKSSSKKNQVLDTMSSGAPVREFTQTPDLPSASYSGFPTSPIGGGRRNDSSVLTEYSSNMLSHASRRNTRELNSSLMERLAQGQKVKISKKDMVALSTKNYHNLPEVKKRVEEKKRKEEKLENLKKRQEKVKDLDATETTKKRKEGSNNGRK